MRAETGCSGLPYQGGMSPIAQDSGFAAKPESALLIVAHGSTESSSSSEPTFLQAQVIRERGLFAEVHCAFWKEEPGFRTVGYAIEAEEVYVVPNFISNGYFTREVIPRELELTGPTTRAHGKTWHWCDPVGAHRHMTGLLLHRAREIAPGADPAQTALLVVGHGTPLNAESAEAIRAQVRLLREGGAPYREILDAYMEEEPRVADWDRYCNSPNVIVLPFFISDGPHSRRDIPRLLGLKPDEPSTSGKVLALRREPAAVRGRTLYYSRAIGTDPAMADIILDQVRDFDRRQKSGVTSHG